MTVDFSTPTSQVSAAGLFTTSQLEIVSKDITSITTLSMYSSLSMYSVFDECHYILQL